MKLFAQDTKPGKELDYLLVRANSWSGKPVYIELWVSHRNEQ